MSLTIERLYPVIGGLIAGVIWYWQGVAFPVVNESAILSSSLTVGAILTGFLATSKAILISIKHSEIVKELQDSGYMSDLVMYLAEAIWATFSFCLIAIIGYFMNGTIYQVVWISFGVMASLSFFRITNIMLKILKKE